MMPTMTQEEERIFYSEYAGDEEDTENWTFVDEPWDFLIKLVENRHG